jgi:hypothetical protein
MGENVSGENVEGRVLLGVEATANALLGEFGRVEGDDQVQSKQSECEHREEQIEVAVQRILGCVELKGIYHV